MTGRICIPETEYQECIKKAVSLAEQRGLEKAQLKERTFSK